MGLRKINTRKKMFTAVSCIAFLFACGVAVARELSECDIYAASRDDNGRLGLGVDLDQIDSEKAISACKKALAEFPNEPRILFQLGRSFASAKEYDDARRYYELSEKYGFELASYSLGKIYLDGLGVEKNLLKAFDAFKKAADAGFIVSQKEVADMYEKGVGTTKNPNKAFEYFKLAADSGDPQAQVRIGLYYRNGELGKEDLKKAFQYFQKAASQGNASGEFYSGYAYSHGEGVSKNIKTAIEYYTRAWNKGHKTSAANLGYLYLSKGAEQNYKLALFYIRSSLTNSSSQNRLGKLYEEGKGVPQNFARAHMWYNISAASGNEYAIDYKARIERKMTVQQVTQAQEMARVCQESRLLNCGEQTNSSSSSVEGKKPAEQSKRVASGSGFFVNEEGHILTNQHVVNGCALIKIREDGSALIPAVLLLASKDDDIAILKADVKPKKHAVFRAGGRLVQGEAVIAYGYPLSGLLASTGNVSTGLVTSLTGLRDSTRSFQISAPVQPGNSGGPLVDDSGLLVGIVTSKLDALKISSAIKDIPQNINFAVRASSATTLLDAKKIKYFSAENSEKKDSKDITAEVRAYSVFIECSY